MAHDIASEIPDKEIEARGSNVSQICSAYSAYIPFPKYSSYWPDLKGLLGLALLAEGMDAGKTVRLCTGPQGETPNLRTKWTSWA